jgi:predicted DNA-binding transcriptional regulator AlpA
MHNETTIAARTRRTVFERPNGRKRKIAGLFDYGSHVEVRELVELLHVNRSTVGRWIKAGEFGDVLQLSPHSIRIPVEAVKSFLERRTRRFSQSTTTTNGETHHEPTESSSGTPRNGVDHRGPAIAHAKAAAGVLA